MEINLESVKLKEEELLCYSQKEKEDLLGYLGHLQIYFGNSGKDYYSKWLGQKKNNSEHLQAILDYIINNLRKEKGVLSNRIAMNMYCVGRPDAKNNHSYSNQCWEFRVLTQDFAFYIRCMPLFTDYNSYVYCYDREKLFKYLASERGLPLYCYSNLLSTKEAIRIYFGESGYYSDRKSSSDQEVNEMNMELGISKAQEEAMRVGSMFGWNAPGADPKNYDENGKSQKNRGESCEVCRDEREGER